MLEYGYCSQFTKNLNSQPGIYKITNLINGKVYIGQSINIEHRIRGHISASFNENDSSYNQPIHAAIRKYGPNNFSYEILENCGLSELDQKEIYYISFYESMEKNKGYNLTRGGEGGVCFNPEIEQRRRQTVKKKYGQEHLMHVPEIKDKIIQTQTEKWGGFLSKSPIITERGRQTKLKKGFYKCVMNLETGFVFTVKDAREWCHIKDPDSIGKHINHPEKHKSCGKIPDDPKITDKSLIGKKAHWKYISYDEYIKLKEQQNELM